MNKILQFIKKLYTYNHCDTCGFTKDSVYVTEYFLEAGIIQCEKCILKYKGGKDE
jgi:ribosomal protein L37AE/L43A